MFAFALIGVMSLLSCACASKEIIRTRLGPPSDHPDGHHVIIAQQHVKVTVADNFSKKYDAGGHYIVHPNDWDALMDEFDSLDAEIKALKQPPRGQDDEHK